MFVAIQREDGSGRAILFGVGATVDEALDDARGYADSPDDLVVVPCSHTLYAAARDGLCFIVVVHHGVAVLLREVE